jgi:hypothetical protein
MIGAKFRRLRREALRVGMGACVLGASVCVTEASARADDAACIQSYEQTQVLRRASKLREAREEAAKCSVDACPAVLSKDCAKWLAEIEQSIPTAVFDVRSASGEELTNVKISSDGAPLVERLDGKAVALDVGPHVLRFESIDGKGLPVEQNTVIHEGDRNRKISVTLPITAPSGEKERPVPVAAFVFGGVAMASLAAGTIFALSGSSKESDLDGCKPSCPSDQVNSVSSTYALSDIFLTAGVVSAVAAAYIFFTRPSVSPGAAASLGQARRPGLTIAF